MQVEEKNAKAPATETCGADKLELLAGLVANGEREPCGLSVEWLMDQLTDNGDRS